VKLVQVGEYGRVAHSVEKLEYGYVFIRCGGPHPHATEVKEVRLGDLPLCKRCDH
jgi:hypothetical protein